MSHTAEPDSGGFFAPCVLMLLQAGERDTAQLWELLTAFGFTHQVGALETTLEHLEGDALICADRGVTAADDADTGQPLRWRLTASGEEWLAARWAVLAESKRLVHRFLQRYPGLDGEESAGASHTSIPSGTPRGHESHGVNQV